MVFLGVKGIASVKTTNLKHEGQDLAKICSISSQIYIYIHRESFKNAAFNLLSVGKGRVDILHSDKLSGEGNGYCFSTA